MLLRLSKKLQKMLMNSVGSIPELKGKGLFVFSDPGGAKPLLAYIKLNSNLKEYIVVSDRVYDFYADFNIEVSPYYENCVEDYLISFKPDFIFTGTSYTSKIELEFIKIGIQHGLTCYSFIDHYTNFLERFKFNGVVQFPDFICVTDEKAFALAESAKLTRPIVISGNYYHEYLKNWKPVMSRDDFMTSLNMPLSSKLIVYAPDPISNVGGIQTYGLDERTILTEILYTLGKLDKKNIVLMIKAHPNQPLEILQGVDRKVGELTIIRDYQGKVNDLLYYSHIVIGMFSNILIEAAILGSPILRCLIGMRQPDPLFGYSNNVVRTSLELEERLKLMI